MTPAVPGKTDGAADRCLSTAWMIFGTYADLGFTGWQVLGSNQRRLSRRFYRPTSFTAIRAADLRIHDFGALVPRRRSVQVPCQNLQHVRQIPDVNEHALDVT
jgi:hypothetical protein